MPKKTKKEKLLAQQHRTHLPFVVKSNGSQAGTSSSPVLSQFSLSLSPQTARSNKIKTDVPHEYDYIKRDITKTVVLTSIILISEFLLTKWLPL